MHNISAAMNSFWFNLLAYFCYDANFKYKTTPAVPIFSRIPMPSYYQGNYGLVQDQ